MERIALAAPGAPVQVAGLRFLVVEADEPFRKALGSMLEGLGASEVSEAADGQAALSMLGNADHPTDVVLGDLDMPGMDGMEFIRHVGQANVPVSMIMASAQSRSLMVAVETMTAAYGVNLLGTIEKPVTPQKLEALQLHQPGRSAKLSRPLTLVALGDSRPIFTLEDITKGLKNKEFEPFFQPRVDVAGGRIVGARALARWRHPVMGRVEPHAFIRPLEESGLIDVLTWEILRKAAACCGAWRPAGLESMVSVRLGVRALASPNLAERVTQTVAGEGLDPRHMILELSDAAANAQGGGELENLARLRVKGFGLSMRNFGAGYTSLQQLTRIAFTELKFDQAYARKAASEEPSRTLLAAMLDTARTLGIASVVEGVETKQDWDLAVKLGCDLAQGYFIAAPMSAGAYPAWARDYTPGAHA